MAFQAGARHAALEHDDRGRAVRGGLARRGRVRGRGVRMSLWRRRSLASTDGVADLARFAEMARQALEYYERTLGVPCPWPKYDIGFVPRLNALAVSVARPDARQREPARPDDGSGRRPAGGDGVRTRCPRPACGSAATSSSRWWDNLWQDEAIAATYVSCTAMQDAGLADPWTAFCYREKARAYQADALPGGRPVSSPVATAADAMLRMPALTYSKGAAVVRQLAALIGDDALRAGLADFMRRFGGGTAGLDDLVACWSRSSGRDLGGWAEGVAARRGREHAAGLGRGRAGWHPRVAGRGAGQARGRTGSASGSTTALMALGPACGVGG